MIWFTSDTHFFHKNVIEYCRRPWSSVLDMNEGLIKNWNDRVRKTERVYVLGDFCFGGSKRSAEILSRLNGHKILIKGNHDDAAHKMIAAGFAEVYENEQITLPNGQKVLLSHFPFYPDQKEQNATMNLDMRYLHKRICRTSQDLWLLHGHVHTSWHLLNNQLNVGVDVNIWAPVSHEAIQKIIADRSI